MAVIDFFIKEAINEAFYGMKNNHGGPFGCVIVKGNEIVGRGHNSVIAQTDPTAHAEIVAIRDACRNLNRFQLEDCVLYTTCEPCPMCMAAIYWSRIKKVYFAVDRQDAAKIGFDDSLIYDELNLPTENRKVKMIELGKDDAMKLFEDWIKKPDKIVY